MHTYICILYVVIYSKYICLISLQQVVGAWPQANSFQHMNTFLLGVAEQSFLYYDVSAVCLGGVIKTYQHI